ncbi:sigma 54-interacting transcriptional regulator [Trichococcus collinsii]|uniref:DNA translocase FtsK n=1 Tax=Trichococcus collinsii TaxID=157076 RepID=A0AB38A3N7_9LACT|nr:sigma 54-interacting transcriptional regulator [Trichococcus collinsii]CZQ99292.1 sugar-specific transcriptional regulator trmb [Trichococcus collinsii]SEA93055.1 Transcriptional regulatory protein LevR, contains PRD, AAA+ and EIIA domains [Trichococcus collinsii]
MSKQKVQDLLVMHTMNLDEIIEDEHLTAEAIAEEVGIARNTISQYLNELVKEGFAFKVKSRPAYFFAKSVFEENFFPIEKEVFDNFVDLESVQMQSKASPFIAFIGSNASMKQAIEQIKSCVHYPNIGLPFMLYGDTGVGKSLLARLTRDYCEMKGLIEPNAPFIELNCAQYFHNQELLSSILFGYKKGAFTGADEDRIGLLEASDGGVLFLDECHRLGPESQEKLFTFLDNGSFSRLGENNKVRHAKVRIIFATTENIKESFLRTFLRRIPITIGIPSLNSRTKHELSEFIFSFFVAEAEKLDRELYISSWLINRLMSIKYEDNVGELKNTIKFMCASAYSRHPADSSLLINSEVIESELLQKFLAIKEIDDIDKKEVRITKDSKLTDFISKSSPEIKLIRETFERFSEYLSAYKNESNSKEFLKTQLAREANTVIDIIVNTERDDHAKTGVQFLATTMKELVNYVENMNYIRIKGNFIIALSHYFYARGNFLSEFPILDSATSEELATFTKDNLEVEEKVVTALLELIETRLDSTLSIEEKMLITYYLKSLNLEVKKTNTRAVILSHGFSTASSIADAVNRFLDEHIFESFDMPFDVPVEKVEEKMIQYVRSNDCGKGLILLVDMGSLLVLGKKLVEYTDGPVLVINNVTTPQALFVGEMLKKGTDIELIGPKIMENLKTSYDVNYPVYEKEAMILTVSQSGLGGAEQLKTFIDSSKPVGSDFIVEAIELSYLEKYGKNNSLFKQYDVKGIIGTTDPSIPDIPYISLEDLISGVGEKPSIDVFNFLSTEELKQFNDALIKNLSIDRLVSAITILDVKRVTEYIDQFIHQLERQLNINLSNAQKALLYVHIAGAVERLIRNIETLTYTIENQSPERRKAVSVIADSISMIEQAYNISIPQDELQYLYDILF